MPLSHAEFWALNTTAQTTWCFPFVFLLRSDASLFFNTRQSHGLSTSDMIDLLVAMQQRGDLAVYREDKGPQPLIESEGPPSSRCAGLRRIPDYTPVWKNPVIYSRAEIVRDFLIYQEHVLNHPDMVNGLPVWTPFPSEMLYYCMTPQGAEKWEQTARVDWNKYCDTCDSRVSSDEDRDIGKHQSYSIGRIGANSLQILDDYFEMEYRLGNRHSPYVSFRRFRTERISPWRATYWKTFPEGFECDFIEFCSTQSEAKTGIPGIWLTREEREERRRDRVLSQAARDAEWSERLARFDWCNKYVRDFPFEGD